MVLTPSLYFDLIPPGRPDSEQLEFYEIQYPESLLSTVSVDALGDPIILEQLHLDVDTPVRVIPIYHALTGELLPLEGPVQLEQLKARTRIRYVRVKFYTYYPTKAGYHPMHTHTALGWQGEHAVHLLGPKVVLREAVFAAEQLTRPQDLDNEFVNTLDKENIEDWYLDADLAV